MSIALSKENKIMNIKPGDLVRLSDILISKTEFRTVWASNNTWIPDSLGTLMSNDNIVFIKHYVPNQVLCLSKFGKGYVYTGIDPKIFE